MVFLLAMLALQDLDQLIDDLGHDSLDRRDAAMVALEKRIVEAMPALRKAAKDAANLDVRAGAQALVNQYSTGALLWKHECGHKGGLIKPLALLGVQGDTAVVECGCVGSPLVALGEATGTIRWESKVGAGYATHYALAKGVVFATINTGPDKIAAVDLATGKTRWTFEGKKGLHRPVLAGTRAIFGGGDGIRAVDLETGKVLWRFETSEWISTPAVDRLAIAPGRDGKLRALDLETGKAVWAAEIGANPSPAAVADGVVYVGAGDRLFALKLDDGSKLWECAARGISHEAPRVEGRVVRYLNRAYENGSPSNAEPPSKPEVRMFEIDGMKAEMPAVFRGDRFHAAIGGFPVLSGERYTGPRKSAVVCLRGRDIDR